MISYNSQHRAGEQPTVLLVEDNPVERELVGKVLRNADFQVIAVDCGDVVMDTVINYQPDLILLDALLPDTDGFDICVQLRSHPKSLYIPVIMLTGLDDVGSINRAYEVGATDFFTKPINHTMLVHRIRYLLRAREVMDELRMSRQSLASAHKAAKIGHWEYDLEKQRTVLSDEVFHLLQLDPTLYDPTDSKVMLDRCHPDDREQVRNTLAHSLNELENVRTEHRMYRADGTCGFFEVHTTIVRDETGIHVFGILMDVSERRESELEVMRLAYGDRLTGLPNRSLLELYLDQAIPGSHMGGESVALLGLDLDLFSRVNNSMGHSAGDAILEQIAVRLNDLVDSERLSAYLDRLSLLSEPKVDDISRNMVSRLAADTFMIALSHVDSDTGAVEDLARRIVGSFQQPFNYRGQELFVTGSVGIAYSESGSTEAETLIQRCDLALHEAKTQGRNRVRAYSGELVSRVSKHLSVQSDLRKALENGEFRLFYQPKISVSDGSVQGFEALIRWIHPVKGLIPPDQFITIAEETGLIVDIGEWVLHSACQQNKAWIDQNLIQVRMAVNVSARQIKEGTLEEVVDRALSVSGLSGDMLELEMTEGVLMSDPASSGVIAGLRERGISISLDDFGTGYSSLSYITRFPIDTIKIDRGFVKDITVGSEKAVIVSAVTNLSHGLNFNVVAEGVETEAELDVIRQLQCDEVQGFYFCLPMSAEDIAVWLRNRSAPAAAMGKVS